jgi:hypothetical protein
MIIVSASITSRAVVVMEKCANIPTHDLKQVADILTGASVKVETSVLIDTF